MGFGGYEQGSARPGGLGWGHQALVLRSAPSKVPVGMRYLLFRTTCPLLVFEYAVLGTGATAWLFSPKLCILVYYDSGTKPLDVN